MIKYYNKQNLKIANFTNNTISEDILIFLNQFDIELLEIYSDYILIYVDQNKPNLYRTLKAKYKNIKKIGENCGVSHWQGLDLPDFSVDKDSNVYQITINY